MIIYFVTKNDEIVYIGQTRVGLKDRQRGHISKSLAGGNSVLGAAIRKHGPEAFVWKEHSKYLTQIELDLNEKKLIALHTPRYNMAPGGQYGIEWAWNKGLKEKRPEVLSRISEAAKNRRRTKRGPATLEANKARQEVRIKNLRLRTKKFKCHQVDKIYELVVDAAKDLNIPVNGIYAVLNPKHRMKSYKGFTFSYI